MHVSTQAMIWLAPATKAIWLPAGVEHSIKMQGEVAMRTLYVAPSRSASLAAGPAVLEVAPLLREVIVHIVRVGMLTPALPEQDRLAGVLVDLIRTARSEDLFLPLPTDARAARLAQRLQAYPANTLEGKSLSELSGASQRTLQRIFPRETGLTVDAWRQKARLIHAVASLTAGASVTTAALESGYQSVGAFIAAFSRQFGVTPGRYGSRHGSLQQRGA